MTSSLWICHWPHLQVKPPWLVPESSPRQLREKHRLPWSGWVSSYSLTLSVACSPDEVLQKFSELATAHNHSIPKEQLQDFVQSYFLPVGQELQSWTPADWKDR